MQRYKQGIRTLLSLQMLQEYESALTQTQSFLVSGNHFLSLLFIEILMQDCERHWFYS